MDNKYGSVPLLARGGTSDAPECSGDATCLLLERLSIHSQNGLDWMNKMNFVQGVFQNKMSFVCAVFFSNVIVFQAPLCLHFVFPST